MSIENRPFIGSWKMGAKKLVQHTPDALVYINGDLALPGCQKCNSRIDIQKYLTEVSVDASTDAGGASASFTLSIPQHAADSMIRDAQFILRAGLEVHIYMRGYFPVKGLYSNLANPTDRQTFSPTSSNGTTATGTAKEKTPIQVTQPVAGSGKVLNRKQWKDAYEADFRKAAEAMYPDRTTQDKFVAQALIWSHSESIIKLGNGTYSAIAKPQNILFGQPGVGDAGSRVIQTTASRVPGSGSTGYVPFTYAAYSSPYEAAKSHAEYMQTKLSSPSDPYGFEGYSYYTQEKLAGFKSDIKQMGLTTTEDAQGKTILVATTATTDAQTVRDSLNTAPTTTDSSDQGTGKAPVNMGESFLSQEGLAGKDVENVLAYPYYHVFHGVVTQVTHSYSGGANTASIQCVSMLHFWQFHQMSTNASAFGQRPTNSGLKMSMVGNNFTGKHPYEIMYELHNDTAGSAGGVAWAISQQTNQAAKSSLSGDSLFHLNIKYWEKRFNTRDIKLRMHGATGELFNAAQAAYLSRLSASKLMGLLRGRFGGPSGVPTKIMSEAKAVGLGSKRKLEALLYAQKTKGDASSDTKKPSFDLSMPEMLAFVSDIAQWGQVQLFESTYESKLDVAHKVCEVTGFEFYQDVDGDFVFKPPMYNLSTKTSRVYRVEDIDIISINFDDKEPQVTYMVCKGSQFANIKGTGTEGEWGVQGQYIDYRLVAQFGWRPGNFETAYLTDPKSMFFAAVNRLDIMNAPTTSASATIPLRPELRPGYPVYIPYLDSYYYCNSFAHGFSVGGSCTTSLQLIARRSKFYAPGDTTKKGIEAIHLEYPNLPTKPLQVTDSSGRPRLAGFPNVVMALDPTQIDPLFFIVGTDIENVKDDDTLEGLLRMAIKLGIVTPVIDAENTADPKKLGPYFTMSVDGTTNANFYFKTGGGSSPKGSGFDLKKAAATYVTKTEAANKKIGKTSQTVVTAGGKVTAAEQNVNAKLKAGENTDAAEKQKEKAAKALATAQQNQESLQKTLDTGLAADSTNGMDQFIKLLRSVSEKFSGSKQFSQRYGSNPGSASTLLDMLADKKAVFTNGSLPGSYRYYSCSHPDPEQQGSKNLTINLRAGKKETGGKAIQLADDNLDDAWKNVKIPMFSQHPTATQPGGLIPEAQIIQGSPTRGIRVLSGTLHGKVLPTSEIREMMFTVHNLLSKKTKVKRAKFARADTLGVTLRSAMVKQAGTLVLTPQNGDISITEAMAFFVFEVGAFIARAVQQEQQNLSKIPVFPTFDLPQFIDYNGTIDTNVKINTFKFLDNPAAGTVILPDTYPEIYPNSGSVKMTGFWLPAATAYAEDVYDKLCDTAVLWKDNMRDQGFTEEEAGKVHSDFVGALQGSYQIKTNTKEGFTSAHPKDSKDFVYSPVFPISDNEGYTVIGSYRYGRGVDIDPAGVFDSLHKQDPLAMLDKTLIDNILSAIVRGEPITIMQKQPNGTNKAVTLKGDEAKNEVERQALAVWRSRWSDKDILDRGLFPTDKEGTTLFHVDLNNWLKTIGQDGITKVPVINAAYSLGDLAPHTTKEFCSCKAAEADVLLNIAGQQNFVQFSAGGKGGEQVDSTIQWVQQAAAAAAIPWTQSQKALRGTSQSQESSSVIQAATSLGDQFKAVQQNIAAKKAAFDASQDNLRNLREEQRKK